MMIIFFVLLQALIVTAQHGEGSQQLLTGRFGGTLGFSAYCFKSNSRILSLLFVVACLGLEMLTRSAGGPG